MSGNELSGATALVTGASRGFGRGIATALAGAGAQVVGVARDRGALEELRAELGGSFTVVVGDAADPMLAGALVDKYHPRVLVLNAGATPLPRPVQQHTWQTFSRNWDVDVAHVFHWTREALLSPLAPGSTVITLSSGAALFGSPLSGGYAGAKAAIRFLTAYAAEESAGAGLGIRFVSLLPQLTPTTQLGAVFAAAYAARQGADPAARQGADAAARQGADAASRQGADAASRSGPGPVVTPDLAGRAVVDLVSGDGYDRDAYVLTGAGLRPLP
jgi:NAD(P)-dependent dehydrogenase (short-subunit alcohol dehydrogenase family)